MGWFIDLLVSENRFWDVGEESIESRIWKLGIEIKLVK